MMPNDDKAGGLIDKVFGNLSNSEYLDISDYLDYLV